MSGLASALEISAKIIREHQSDPVAAFKLIRERKWEVTHQVVAARRIGEPNLYLERMLVGYAKALDAAFEVSHRRKP